MSAPDFDLAILGAGVSGVYTGWRIATANANDSPILRSWARDRSDGRPAVAVFEASDRIGGRLLSAQSHNAPETICELGGMRYVSSQKYVRSLVENRLHLCRHEQVVDREENIAFLRGRNLRMSQTRTPDLLPYDLTWAERQLLAKGGPTSLMVSAIAAILPDVQTRSGQDLHRYLQNAEFESTPLYRYGFWNLLARAMSTEAYQLARTMVGYDVLGENFNAVDMILEYFDFTPDVKYYVLDGGYDVVPWTLQSQYASAGGKLFKNSRVVSFELTALSDDTTGIKLHIAGTPNPITARAVLLAMPRVPVERLVRESPLHKHDELPGLLASVEPIPLYKVFVVYPFPWWQCLGISQGRSLTDLPLRQCYYWPNGKNGTTSSVVSQK